MNTINTPLGSEEPQDSLINKVGALEAGLGKKLTLRLQVELDGETIIDREGDSLLLGFIRRLHQQMAGYTYPVNYIFRYHSDTEKVDIVSCDDPTSDPLRLNWETDTSSFSHQWDDQGQNTRLIFIEGHPQLSSNGPFYVTNDSGLGDNSGWIELNEAVWDESQETWVDSGNSFTLPDPANFSVDFNYPVYHLNTDKARRYYDVFRNFGIWVGTNDTPVVYNDVVAGNYNRTNLEFTGTTRAAPAVSTYESEMTFSKSVTNNTGEDVVLKDIKLVDIPGQLERQTAKNDNIYVLLARDLVDVTIPDGSTVTFHYSFVVDCSAGGGVMAQFNELLYRHAATTTREVVDVYNNNRTEARSFWTFCVSHGVPNVRHRANGDQLDRTLDVGIMVGTGTGEVSNTDYALESRIEHGEDAGELLHWGTRISEVTIDDANGRAYFTIERIFENKTDSDITINEVGIYCGASGFDNSSIDANSRTHAYLKHFHLITRNVLDTPITIQTGKFRKLYYEVGITV